MLRLGLKGQITTAQVTNIEYYLFMTDGDYDRRSLLSSYYACNSHGGQERSLRTSSNPAMLDVPVVPQTKFHYKTTISGPL